MESLLLPFDLFLSRAHGPKIPTSTDHLSLSHTSPGILAALTCIHTSKSPILMAFPFEPTQLRAQLRAFALSTNDDTQTACRIVKPLVLGLYYDQYNQEYLKDFRSVSPPIPSELPPDVGKSVPLQLGHHKRYNRKSQQKPVSKAVHKKAASQSKSGKKKKKRLKDKLRNPLTKLFQKSDASRLHDDSDSSSGQITLESDHDEDSKSLDTSALLIMPADETRRLNNLKLQDGELVVVAEMETGHAPTKKERDYRLDDSFGGASDGDNTVDDDVLEDELEESSSDSAFTDIEADSMIDVDSIEYTVPESYVLEEAQSKYNSKKKGRKMKQSSASLLEKSGKPLNADSLLADLGVDAYSKSSSTRLDKSLQLLPRRSSFTFEKIYNTLDAEPKLST
ncbi:CIC11C00000000673 [Sungouiella intermedia]|uniref:CIC11C00000000673 n=1 Tax=Sungouiella intermedia TaxID=45354 RepID=A0A1L0BJN8_9ASCO|nr:CIC11C00000000673 [[Candida] intermedia]